MGSLGFAPTGWDFTAYTSTTTSIETLSDSSGGDSDSALINDAVTVTGAGASGASVETASGNYQWDRQTSTLAPTTLSTAAVLAGPTLPGFNPAGNPANWMLSPGAGPWTPAAALTAIAAKLTAAPAGTVVAALVPAGPVLTAGGLAPPAPSLMMMGLGLGQTPPLLAGLAAGPVLTPTGYASIMGNSFAAGFAYRGWLGPLTGNPALIGPSAYAPPWAFVNALAAGLAQAANADNTAYTGALTHFAVGQAQALYQAAVARVHGVPVLNAYAYFGMVVDFVGGVVNSLTAGLASRLVGAVWSALNASLGVSLFSLVNTTSAAYAAGGEVGQVLGIVLMMVPGVGEVMMAIQAVGMALNAADAFARGDTQTGFLDLEGALLAGVGAAEAAEAAEGSIAVAEEGAEGLEAGETSALNDGMIPPEPAMQVPSGGPSEAGMNLTERSPPAELPQEEYTTSDSLDNQCQKPGECFTAEIELFTPKGLKRICQIRPDEYVLARTEYDADGPVEPKRVLRVFLRTAAILRLRLGGRLIRTTRGHPFWVRGKGWRSACELSVGEELVGKDGEWTAVEDVEDRGEVATVYNLEVEDHHTYFVGGDGWGFAVWAHNAKYPAPGQKSFFDIDPSLDPEASAAGSGEDTGTAGDGEPGGAESESAPQSNVQANKAKGDAFRDDVADRLEAEGFDVRKEAVKNTPFGQRRIDIEVSKDGEVLGGVETKAGPNARYNPSQRAKDAYLQAAEDYPVTVVRDA